MLAAKFLLAARILGPEQMGLVGFATLTLAVAESMSDTGLMQALIQNKIKHGKDELGAAWTLQSSRGFSLALILVAVAGPISVFFHEPMVRQFLYIAAVIPVLRDTVNPGYAYLQREKNFRKTAFFEIGSSAVDLSLTLGAIHLGYGASSVLLGTIAGEGTTLVLTWMLLSTRIRPNFHWGIIKELTGYGKWVWGTSVATFLLNQADKILVGKLLGTMQLGIYQVANRMSQLIISDSSTALGQYLFPVFSAGHRISRDEARAHFDRTIRMVGLLAFSGAAILALGAGMLIRLALGPQWIEAVPYLRIMAFSMGFGAVIAVQIAYSRAIGKPQIVTHAVIVQLAVLALCAPVLIIKFGGLGMAVASGLALASAVGMLAFKISRSATP